MRGSASPKGEARREAPARQSKANAAPGRITGGGGRGGSIKPHHPTRPTPRPPNTRGSQSRTVTPRPPTPAAAPAERRHPSPRPPNTRGSTSRTVPPKPPRQPQPSAFSRRARRGRLRLVEQLPAPELPAWIAKEVPFTRYRVAVGDGLHMHVMETGRGRPVLLVHGNPTWGFLYRKVAMCLQGQGLRLIMPDLIGFGFSDNHPRLCAAHHPQSQQVAWLAHRPARHPPM